MTKTKKKTSKYHKHHTLQSCLKDHPYFTLVSLILAVLFIAAIYYTLQINFTAIGLGAV